MTALSRIPFIAGALLLAIHPIAWLVRTWTSPAYESAGVFVAILALSLTAWSIISPRIEQNSRAARLAPGLLLMTALLRLAGQVLGVNIISALPLVIDVYALALFAGLDVRRRPLSPGWLAVLFAASFPFEFLVRRTAGFALQGLSASAACGILSLGPDPVHCEGVQIVLAGHELLVDLPCSGARGLLLSIVLFSALAAMRRPSAGATLIGLIITGGSTLIANALRIAVLAEGAAFPERLLGISVMESPSHDVIGLITLALGLVPIVAWAHFLPPTSAIGTASTPPLPQNRKRLGAGLAFAAIAVLILQLPSRPIDVTPIGEPVSLPLELAERRAVSEALSRQEEDYFIRYGGSAARARYGHHELLVVRTAAPLRHLHAPEECLAGAGNQISYLGIRRLGAPMAEYRAVDPAGQTWRVGVAFVSDQGGFATSVGEAVWQWFRHPTGTWTMVQTIAPWDTPEGSLLKFRESLARAFDLPTFAQNDRKRRPS